MKQRFYSLVAMLVVVTLVLSACGSGAGSGSLEKPQVQEVPTARPAVDSRTPDAPRDRVEQEVPQPERPPEPPKIMELSEETRAGLFFTAAVEFAASDETDPEKFWNGIIEIGSDRVTVKALAESVSFAVAMTLWNHIPDDWCNGMFKALWHVFFRYPGTMADQIHIPELLTSNHPIIDYDGRTWRWEQALMSLMNRCSDYFEIEWGTTRYEGGGTVIHRRTTCSIEMPDLQTAAPYLLIGVGVTAIVVVLVFAPAAAPVAVLVAF